MIQSIEVEENNKEMMSSRVELFQNYPNPFNPETGISYQLPSHGHVELKVFDMLGRNIATLVDKEQHPGNYEVKFNGGNLESGIYLYRIKVFPASQVCKTLNEDSVKIKKMVLIK